MSQQIDPWPLIFGAAYSGGSNGTPKKLGTPSAGGGGTGEPTHGSTRTHAPGAPGAPGPGGGGGIAPAVPVSNPIALKA